jgi:hypothetical protein
VQYHLSAISGTVHYTVKVPAWLSVPLDFGTADTTGRTITVLLNKHAAARLRPGSYGPGVAFTVTNGNGGTVTPATLLVNPRSGKF